MDAADTPDQPDTEGLEISLPAALELCKLELATLIDIRQSFEIEMKGTVKNESWGVGKNVIGITVKSRRSACPDPESSK